MVYRRESAIQNPYQKCAHEQILLSQFLENEPVYDPGGGLGHKKIKTAFRTIVHQYTEDCKLVVTCKMHNRNATDKLNQQCSKLALLSYHKFQ